MNTYYVHTYTYKGVPADVNRAQGVRGADCKPECHIHTYIYIYTCIYMYMYMGICICI